MRSMSGYTSRAVTLATMSGLWTLTFKFISICDLRLSSSLGRAIVLSWTTWTVPKMHVMNFIYCRRLLKPASRDENPYLI
jgi:hypothetical protein